MTSTVATDTVRTRWAAALTNGRFTGPPPYNTPIDPCYGPLKQGDKLSVLGVLCEMYRRDHPGVEWEYDVEGNAWYFLNRMFILPPAVAAWANTTDCPTIVGRHPIKLKGLHKDRLGRTILYKQMLPFKQLALLIPYLKEREEDSA